APSEARHQPTLVVVLVLRRVHPGPCVRADASHRLDGTEVAQRVAAANRIVEVLAVVEDAALAGPEQEVPLRQDLVPELLDGGHLGEEPVTTHVEAPTVALGGPADP